MIEDPRMNLVISLDHPHAKAILTRDQSGELAVEMVVEIEGVQQRYRLIRAPELHYDTRHSHGFARTEWAPIGEPQLG